MDLIDRKALVAEWKSKLKRLIPDSDGMHSISLEKAIEALEKAPTVEAEPVRHGKWENYPSHTHRRCSLCKMEWEKPRFNIRANYCPNCGAKMDGDKQ